MTPTVPRRPRGPSSATSAWGRRGRAAEARCARPARPARRARCSGTGQISPGRWLGLGCPHTNGVRALVGQGQGGMAPFASPCSPAHWAARKGGASSHTRWRSPTARQAGLPPASPRVAVGQQEYLRVPKTTAGYYRSDRTSPGGRGSHSSQRHRSFQGAFLTKMFN